MRWRGERRERGGVEGWGGDVHVCARVIGQLMM